MEVSVFSIMTKTTAILLVVLPVGLVAPAAAQEKWQVDLESGLAVSGYNNVRIPGSTGTEFSLSRDLDIDQTVFWRVRFSHMFGDKHSLSILIAPLTFNADGRLDKDVGFAGSEFAANSFVKATYRFDSYRLTYRNDFYRRDGLRLGIGFTGKIRDAAIGVEGGGQKAEKTNTGFVPLINFRAQWTISSRLGVLFDGDALAAPQGRAEDVLLALTTSTNKNLQFKFGYRLLEGGADNDAVYTFALVNYLVLGATWRF
jgi:hypothetical protein